MPHEENSKAMSEACKFCSDKGLDGMGPAMSILLNEAIASERSGALNAQPWERTDERQGLCNGFKDRRLDTRRGDV